MDSKTTVNNLLVGLFDGIVDWEEKELITDEFKDISKNDMHIIDVIGNCETKNMSTLAKKLKVTVGTLTIAINNLVKKGYVQRVRSLTDKRVVLVSLSDKGKHAYQHYSKFHRNLVDQILDGLDQHETEIFIQMLKKMHELIEEK